MSNQGRKLKKRLIGNGKIGNGKDGRAGLTLEEVSSSLHESRIFADREAVGSILNRDSYLNLKYYTLYSFG